MDICTEIQSLREDYLFSLFSECSSGMITIFAEYLLSVRFKFWSKSFEGREYVYGLATNLHYCDE